MSESVTQPHPDADELRLFVLGKLSEKRSQAIEQHLMECMACSGILEGETVEDPFVRLVRDADGPGLEGGSHVEDVTRLTGGRDDFRPTGADAGTPAFEVDGYEILGEVGRGGMGVVYRARDTQLKRDVALKVILAGVHASHAEKDRFRREAETLARLQHPGIVQIHDVGEQDGHLYLALEFIEGPTLGQLTRREPQPVRWSATMVLQLAGAVDFTHQQSIVHRDLKPGNVLVVRQPDRDGGDSTDPSWVPRIHDSTGEATVAVPLAKITDFGVARQLDSEHRLTRTGQSVGTPAYMSPEQVTGGAINVGPATDVYALGAILYELLTGRPPFVSDDAVSIVMAVLEDDPESPGKHRPNIPRDLETICLKCLLKEPARRYRSAHDLAVDLELFLQGEPIHARRLSVMGRLLRWARHHPLPASTYLACTAMLVLHLIARYVLRLPIHNDSLRWFIPIGIAGWTAGTALLEWLRKHRRPRILVQFGYFALTVPWLTVGFLFDAGPSSAPVPVYLVAIAISALVLPRPAMTWFVSGLCTVSYLGLLAWAHWKMPENQVPIEHALAMLMSFGLMGAAMHLLLRRAVDRRGTGDGHSL